MQLFRLGREHHLVGDLLGDHVAEHELGPRRRGHRRHEVEAGQRLEVLRERGRVDRERVDLGQPRRAEPLPDDTGHLERQRFARRQLIEARRDDPLDRVGDQRLVEPLGAGRPDEPVLDHDASGVPHRERELLDEQRVAFRPLEDHRRDRVGDPGRACPFARQRERVLPREATDTQDRHGVAERPQRRLVGVARRARRDHQQQIVDLAAGADEERPGGGIEPVGVLEDDHERAGSGLPGQDPDQQVAGVVGPDDAAHLGGVGVVLEVERQHVVQQRGQPKALRVGTEPLGHQRAASGPVGDRREAEQVLEHGPPGLVWRRRLDLDGRADDRAHTARGSQPEPLRHQSRLADPGFALEHDERPYARDQAVERRRARRPSRRSGR